MKQKNVQIILMGLLIFATTLFLVNRSVQEASNTPTEKEVVSLELSGFAAQQGAEISGLAWFGDYLILLPQYPQIFDENGDGFLFYLPKAEILAYLDGTSRTALQPRLLQLSAPDFADQVRNYQGFESIGFSDSKVFMTIEAGQGVDMQGFLISGEIDASLFSLTLDTTNLVLLQPQAVSANHSDESLLVLKDKVITFYEVNGKNIVAEPVAHVFDFDLNSLGTIPMPNLEYRLTDTALESENEFWGINYFFSGDVDLFTSQDPLVMKFGQGQTHTQYEYVERLVKFKYSASGIELSNQAPLQLKLIEEPRNWEGLVVLKDKGFLIVTDKFPETILGFVPFP